MSRIALLSEQVASQVAAGEVVERPASVVKELVENSIDAGAKKIEVAIRRGGISSIRVVDDGFGMDRDDALLCLERHATSKIRTGDDLASIHTLGFRGEALPSIASVSRFRLATREPAALAGTEVIVNGGKIESVKDCGDAPGTQIEVRSLFYNLPARRKFLRTENTESSHVEHQLHLQAIGHPEIGFVFVNDERVVYQLPPTTHLRERIRDLCGAALAAELLEVPEFAADNIRIRGFVGKAGVSRSSRAQQLIFLNGRAVENSTLNFALREGYHTALMKGQHPVTFLFIDMDPAAVDVNVHPAKREVRFRNSAEIREAIVEAIRRTLETDRAEWSATFRAGTSAETANEVSGFSFLVSGSPAPPVPETPPLIPIHEQVALRRDWGAFPQPPRAPITPISPIPPITPTEVSPTSPTVPAAAEPIPPAFPDPETPSAQDFKILGVLGKLYVLMENATGLVLVDQHAAHERILFEEMLKRMESQGVPTQRLLLPLTLQVSPRDADWITHHLDVLNRAGIGLEPFGAGTFKIDSLPTFLRGSEPSQLLREIIDDLRETSAQTSKLRLGEHMIAKTVCRHAVKANDVLREPELVRLIQDLLACDLPYCCPHGRPTMIQMSYSELEKKFGRKV
ncbi:DNA mismatch repair protein MutL [Chthoniobacter flavus Ellin428]|uniref:DNA mismatch repair protein MutL n=1 Tax=Chthoniobacter flavus Ellin428 TaxID=497964 RepID=B4D994_9BACT|nr:DNA mismatch repair endonuclease MutL [Chthoniobacter flavus]EDY16997.1 DNA mismatch repair protein MutL [Chthoniobacter flavus Ellin428]TCO86082.1 DNA mismatch repair protein MutL [Chthoniobacter flavus]